jgi:4-alpha-glucanotransferase
MNLNQRSSGVLLHITSLPGPHGMGDFGPDAYRFVDWLQGAGQSSGSCCPPRPSARATALPGRVGLRRQPVDGGAGAAGRQGWLARRRCRLLRGRVDYGRVTPWREQQLRAAAAGFFAGAARPTAGLRRLVPGRAGWLDDYALFMAIRSPLNGQPWWTWDDGLKRREPRPWPPRASSMPARSPSGSSCSGSSTSRPAR